MGSQSLSLQASREKSGVSRDITRTVLNLVLFQIGWFACVLSAAAGSPSVGAGIAVGIVTFHLFRASVPGQELFLVLSALAIGTVWESLLVWMNLVSYEVGTIIRWAAPYWIILMWGLFATILNVSLRWLRGRWLLQTLGGLAGGPLAFYGGHRLGALEFGNESVALFILALGWAVLTPLLMTLSVRFDGYGKPTTRRTS
jgi:hypothetical protein